MIDHRSYTYNKSSCKKNRGFEPKLCVWSFKYSLELNTYPTLHYPGCQRFFFSLKATELSGEAKSRSGEKKILRTHKMTSS